MRDASKIICPPRLIRLYGEDPQAVAQNYPEGAVFCDSMEEMYQLILTEKNIESQKNVIGELLTETLGEYASRETMYNDFTNAIKAAKGFREELIREFAPEKIRFVFTSDGVARPTDDPVELVKIMMRPPGSKQFADVRSFEATLFWTLGMRYLIMRRQNKRSSNFLSRLTVNLEETFFADNVKLPREEEVKIIYDPKNDYRFVGFVDKNSPGKNIFSWPMSYRFILDDTHIIKTLYDSRYKREQDLFRKTLEDSLAANPVAPDSNGITLVYFSEKDLHTGIQLLRKKVFRNIAANINSRRNGHDNESSKKNRFSSGQSLPEWHYKTYYLGEVVELQIFLFENFFNRKFCLGAENHHFYRLRQIIELLVTLAPQEIYNINWREPKLTRAMQAMQIARSRVNY